MTIRDCYENCLIELNKVQAPSLLLDDFIYLFNKAVQQYYNERYNLFETKQQLTDDLRVLTKTIKIVNPDLQPTSSLNAFTGTSSYDCKLPDDYVHVLNCICEFKDSGALCEAESTFQQGANKLDTNQWPHVINNYYMLPSVKRPYYYIINLEEPDKTSAGMSDLDKNAIVKRGSEQRYGNSVTPIMLIKYGNKKNSAGEYRYTLEAVYLDYLRAPLYMSVDQDLLDDITDNSQVIEFPDYVVYEIINKITLLCMENAKDQREQTFPAATKSVV